MTYDNLRLELLQVVTSTHFGTAAGHDIHATQATVAKWGFADNAIALAAPAFVQNKVAQLLAALAAVCLPAHVASSRQRDIISHVIL